MNSLRALGCLLTRRFSPRVIPVMTSAAKVACRRAAIGATTAALAGLVGFSYFKKEYTAYKSAAEEIKTTEVTAAEETRKNMRVSEAVNKDGDMDDAAVRAMFMDENGKMRWHDYVDYLTFGQTFENVTTHYDDDEEEDENNEEQEDAEYEAAMKARFEEWMKEYNKTYGGEEETALRYKRFKRSAKRVDKYNASRGVVYLGLNHFADITEEEIELMTPDPPDDDDWEEYVEILKAIQAHCKMTGESSVRASVIYKQLGKDCSYFEETESSIEEALEKRKVRAEEAARRYFEEKARKNIGK